ncbi:MAG: hypothetical protein AAB131_08375 [Actinomycetota bacterium]
MADAGFDCRPDEVGVDNGDRDTLASLVVEDHSAVAGQTWIGRVPGRGIRPRHARLELGEHRAGDLGRVDRDRPEAHGATDRGTGLVHLAPGVGHFGDERSVPVAEPGIEVGGAGDGGVGRAGGLLDQFYSDPSGELGPDQRGVLRSGVLPPLSVGHERVDVFNGE